MDLTARVNEMCSQDIWQVMRHAAAITLANRDRRPYSMKVWNGYEYVTKTYNTENN